ncbi:hypothetical protein [Tabrizicola sp. BL-A-41-H6]|uniref:hypothetical protein n=1 Tax=Tabrizicola sp. BL-A-41-H6 TaxID=3421107 RepID=UPI003D678717
MTADEWLIVLIPLAIFLVVAGYVIRRERLKDQRRKSLRRDEGGGYVWVEIDGTPGRSRDDPRDRWDAQNAVDADGDGGGD